ncbi:alpha beta hydrolase [Lecanosticta acicola]|uniref:Alpha beta hydrolase n=1 Tax=Lecanosticta acicola TaxID=111012 RepID=A0AAI8Z4K3_9PEZI|nr:alpha beta hydrolase [Lecanosticta acicola]
MPFTLDPAIGAALAAQMGPDPPPPLAVGDVQGRRRQLDLFFSGVVNQLPDPQDVSTQDFTTQAEDGHTLTLRWFTKTGTQPPGSAVLYAHGGGMIALGLKHYDQIIKRYVSRTGVPFLLVDYRLAPEVQAPIPVTDTYTGLRYLHSHASDLGIQPSRIAIMGDSAGGGITASLAHYIKLRGGGPPVAKQILIYPMLDDRNTAPDPLLSPFLTWTTADNATGWTALLGARIGADDVNVLEAAGRMTAAEARGLPPAYIDVGGLDLFRDESIEYARTLGKGGVSVELHVIPNAPHAFEGFAPEAEISRFVMDMREKVIKSI